MDPLLTRSLAGGEAAGEPCPDTELLAAFADGDLATDERHRIETHAADCGRCSRILALTIASAPVAEVSHADVPAAKTAAVVVPIESGARWRTWRRLATVAVPLATAAAVAGIWVATSSVPVPTTPVAETELAGAAARLEAPLPLEPAAPSPQAQSSARLSAPSAPPERPAQDARRQQQESLPAPPAAGNAVAPSERARAEAALSAAASDSAAEAQEKFAAPPPPPAAPSPASAPPAEALARARGAVAALRVAAPDGRTMWRVNGAQIERSLDGGLNWMAETTEAQPLTSGVGVSADVAWLAGRQGRVLRRTAIGWAAVTAPAAADITAIRATSATDASVTLADGRMMETEDGGTTWR